MATLAETLAQAVHYHQSGALQAAEYLYRQVLGADPNNADAFHLLGVLASQVGRHDQAVAYIQQALALRPLTGSYFSNLGIALKALGRQDEALASFQAGASLQPDLADAHFNVGTALKDLGRCEEALASLNQALRLRPTYVEAHLNLGVALAACGKLEEAAASYQQVLRLEPGRADACNNLGNALSKLGKLDEAAASLRAALHLRPDYADAHFNLANVLVDQGKPLEAVACFREALRLNPQHAQACNNLGNALHSLGQLDPARASLEEALRQQHDHAQAHYNLGNVLRDQGLLEEAATSFRQAIRCQPDYAQAHSNLGNVLQAQAKLDEALASYEQALRLQPDHAETHVNRAMAWLVRGDFRRGWAEYEWRWRRPGHAAWPLPQPRWDGAPLAGRTILLYAEQGLGDTLHFIRYAPLVKERGGRVIVACPKALVPLLRRCPGIDDLIEAGAALPPFDVQAPLLSLPGVFGTDLTSIPANVPYLHAEPERVAAWGRELEAVPGFKIGIAWQGNPAVTGDRRRSFPLVDLAPLARLEGVHLFSLQKGPGAEQTSAHQGRVPVLDWSDRLDLTGAFLDTAAVMQHLDLVIAPDSAIAHLAGALGVPVWVALSSAADWRWLLGRQDSPWYPTMRLFRQTTLGNWPDVFERMAAEVPRA